MISIYFDNMKKIIIGVMGAGETAKSEDTKNAFELGKLIARQDWVLLTGGISSGIMDAASRGAKEARGLTVGIIPKLESKISEAVDIPIITNMGSARNYINVLSSDVVIVCGSLSPGTLSEVALALGADKKVILLGADGETKSFIKKTGGDKVFAVTTPAEAIELTKKFIEN